MLIDAGTRKASGDKIFEMREVPMRKNFSIFSGAAVLLCSMAMTANVSAQDELMLDDFSGLGIAVEQDQEADTDLDDVLDLPLPDDFESGEAPITEAVSEEAPAKKEKKVAKKSKAKAQENVVELAQNTDPEPQPQPLTEAAAAVEEAAPIAVEDAAPIAVEDAAEAAPAAVEGNAVAVEEAPVATVLPDPKPEVPASIIQNAQPVQVPAAQNAVPMPTQDPGFVPGSYEAVPQGMVPGTVNGNCRSCNGGMAHGGYWVPNPGPGRKAIYYGVQPNGIHAYPRRECPGCRDCGPMPYPYYTLRGPRDFNDPNPRPIGP